MNVFLEYQNKTKAFTIITSMSHGVDSSSNYFFFLEKYKEKEIIGLQSVKEEIRLSLLANGIIINVENPAEFTQKAASSNK